MSIKSLLDMMDQLDHIGRRRPAYILNHIAVNGRNSGIAALDPSQIKVVRQFTDRLADGIIVFEHRSAGRVGEMHFTHAILNDPSHRGQRGVPRPGPILIV